MLAALFVQAAISLRVLVGARGKEVASSGAWLGKALRDPPAKLLCTMRRLPCGMRSPPIFNSRTERLLKRRSPVESVCIRNRAIHERLALPLGVVVTAWSGKRRRIHR